MRGKLNGSTFETPDGYKYYKLKSDALQIKLYFRCRMYTKGCRVILHTNYTDRDDDDLKVIFKAGKHNHGEPDQNSSDCGVGRGSKRKYARVVDDDEDSELEDEDDDEDGDGEESDDGEDSEEDGADEEEESGEDEEEDEETEDDKKCRYSYGLVILNYLQYLNVLSDEMFKEALKHICPFEYELIYTIMGVYSECAKGREITIDDAILTRRVDHTMNTLVRLVKEGAKNKRFVKIFRENRMPDMLREIIAHFVKAPTLIFSALVTYLQ